MTTSNAPITVTVGLERPSSCAPAITDRLDAKVTLVTDARKGGNFSVTGTTSNGPLAIAVPGSPVDSALSFMARTSNGAAESQGGSMRPVIGGASSTRACGAAMREGIFILKKRIKIWGV
ncbi:hypothetical protein B0H13DRAFT_2345049 [Mycena leptocephala]|nr:hypothetical protein B0H13DRAFT_2345049 [Mycena leptocephala]